MIDLLAGGIIGKGLIERDRVGCSRLARGSRLVDSRMHVARKINREVALIQRLMGPIRYIILYGAGGSRLYYVPWRTEMDNREGLVVMLTMIEVVKEPAEITYRVEKGIIKKREGITKWREYDVVVGETALNHCLRRFRLENPSSNRSTFRVIPVEAGTVKAEVKPFPFWLRKKNKYTGTNSTNTIIGPVLNKGLGL